MLSLILIYVYQNLYIYIIFFLQDKLIQDEVCSLQLSSAHHCVSQVLACAKVRFYSIYSKYDVNNTIFLKPFL